MNDSLKDALKALGRPKADATFREHVRHEFLEGSAQGKSRGHKKAWLVGTIAASILLVLSLWNAPRNTAPEWHLMSTGGSIVEGTIHNPGPGDMEIAIENAIQWRLQPGTTIRLTQPEAGAPLKVFVKEGVALATTGPEFPKQGLLVETDFVNITVTGTTFGILAGPDSTCVCVLEGVVVSTEDRVEIHPGMVRTTFACSAVTEAPLSALHKNNLQALSKSY